MGLVLGVEGDGSHSHAALTDASGRLLGFGANDDSSDWDQNGIAAAAAALRSCITEALRAAGSTTDDVDSSVFALAGVDFPVDERRLSGIPEAIGLRGRCRIVNDSFAALRAGTDRHFGAVIVAGTGSVVAGRNRNGEEYRSLGLGRMYGDFGSETDISEIALLRVAQAFTGRAPQTALTQLLSEAAEAPSVVDLLDGAARGRIDPTRFGPLVMLAAAEGDAVACALLAEAGEQLGATAAHVVRTLGMERTGFDLVLSGRMFDRGSNELVAALERCLHAVAPDAQMDRLAMPPVVGAALMALDLAGRTPERDARSTLADGLGSALVPSG